MEVSLPNNSPKRSWAWRVLRSLPAKRRGSLAKPGWLRVIHSLHLLWQLVFLKASTPRTSILGGLPLYCRNTLTSSHLFLSPNSRLSSAHRSMVGIEVFADEGWSAWAGLCIAPACLFLASISATALNPPAKALKKANPAKKREGKQEIIYMHHKSQHTVTPCTSALEGQQWLNWIRLLQTTIKPL